MICESRSLVNSGSSWGVAVTLRCRSWSCPLCAPKRAAELCRTAAAGNPNKLITLTTSAAAGATPNERARALSGAWRLVAKRIRRRWPGQELSYFAVFEATKRGQPHLHILARSPFIPQHWLSAQMAELIGSPIVDIRKVYKVGDVARYLAKYIGKAPHRFGTTKRYWSTPGWDLSEPEEDEPADAGRGGWVIDERPVWIVYQDALYNARGPFLPRPDLCWWGDLPEHLSWAALLSLERIQPARAAPALAPSGHASASRPRPARPGTRQRELLWSSSP